MSAKPESNLNRIAAVDAAAVLDRLAGSDLLERGSVFVLSVDAIRERSGTRWARRRDDVWGYLARKLHDHLSYQDIHHRIGETDWLVAMTSEEGVAAQAVGLKVLEEVLEFFLGAAERSDLRIQAVRSIWGQELGCEALDPSRVADARAPAEAQPFTGGVSWELQVRHNPVSIISAARHVLQVAFSLEHVTSLRHEVTAALRVEPTVRLGASGELVPARKLAKLPDEDILAIDRATLAFARLFAPEDARKQPPVVAPASFRTMSGRKGREALGALAGVGGRAGFLLELVDLDRGTPTGRLLEVVGLARQLCRGVLARVQPARDILEPVRGARLNGLTLEFANLGLTASQRSALIEAAALQMRGKAAALIALGLPDAAALRIAERAGFTHASLRAPTLKVETLHVA